MNLHFLKYEMLPIYIFFTALIVNGCFELLIKSETLPRASAFLLLVTGGFYWFSYLFP